MADGDRIVIVGAGVAGLRAAERLREQNFDGEIVLIGDEARRPYHRPMVSKALVMGTERPSDVGLSHYLPDLDVHWRLGARVTHLDTTERVVHLPGGESLWYDGLIAATGVYPRHLPGSPRHDPRVRILRTVEDSMAVRRCLNASKKPTVVIGATDRQRVRREHAAHRPGRHADRPREGAAAPLRRPRLERRRRSAPRAPRETVDEERSAALDQHEGHRRAAPDEQPAAGRQRRRARHRQRPVGRLDARLRPRHQRRRAVRLEAVRRGRVRRGHRRGHRALAEPALRRDPAAGRALDQRRRVGPARGGQPAAGPVERQAVHPAPPGVVDAVRHAAADVRHAFAGRRHRDAGRRHHRLHPRRPASSASPRGTSRGPCSTGWPSWTAACLPRTSSRSRSPLPRRPRSRWSNRRSRLWRPRCRRSSRAASTPRPSSASSRASSRTTSRPPRSLRSPCPHPPRRRSPRSRCRMEALPTMAIPMGR